MENKIFKLNYDRAKTVDIKTDEFFNYAGYFWGNLTTRQQKKMTDLLIEQGNQPVDGWISLANGLQVGVR